MNDIAEQRPEFFEGEYLSASDLEQLVIYLRDQAARHTLGGHVWGIVSGLELVVQTSPSGTIDVYLMPGHAVDGYGRAVVVVNPLRLSPNDFTGQPSGLVQVWIRYDQGTTSATRPGFEVCCTGDAYTRIAESYLLEVGPRTTDEQQSGISVSGEAVEDARTAPRTFDDNGPVICDGSVSYQDLPLADEGATWLIPLGVVGWQSGPPGQFRELKPEEKVYSRRLRRYQGAVAESLYASDGVIRLRKRETPLPADETVDQALIDGTCALDEVGDVDLKMCTKDDAKPTFNELVWVEGRLRVTDDVRLFGGRLELRDVNGSDYLPAGTTDGSVPLFLQRTETNPSGTNNDFQNADLEIVIGKADNDGHNRLLIKSAEQPTEDPDHCGKLTFTESIKVAVLDNGNVGIGAEEPDQLLEIENGDHAFIHLEDTKAASDLYLGASEHGGVMATMGNKDLRFRTGGVSDPTDDDDTRMIIDAKGRVGMGTPEPDPDRVLTLEDEGEAYMIARIKTDDDTDTGHEILVGANSDGALVAANTENDDLVLASNANSPVMWIKGNGRVGINTASPGYDLSVHGSSEANIAVRAQNGNHRLLLTADGNGVSVGSNTDDELSFKVNDNVKMTLTTTGRLGIGTTSPSVQLEVRGAIKLGASGQYEAPGSLDRWRIVAGNVGGDGSVVLGSGFTVDHFPGSDEYTVNYNTSFPHMPVVTVTGTNANVGGAPLQWPVVIASNEDRFIVQFVTSGFSAAEERFSFIVFGER